MIVVNEMNNLYLFFIVILYSSCLINSQQLYIGRASFGCSNTDPSTNSGFGYVCNGASRICQSYLTIISYPPYNTVSSISTLLSSDPSQLAQLNSVSLNFTFQTATTVLVPVNCSCSGPYYQVNSTFVIEGNDTFFSTANYIVQGLTSCVSLQSQNSNLVDDALAIGTIINVPLRCACPTTNQIDIGINYLVSYVIQSGDSVSAISSNFGVDIGRTLQANGLTEQDATSILPNTTLLIPLQNPPNTSQINRPPTPQTPQSPPIQIAPPQSQGSSSKVWIYVVVGIVGGLLVAIISGVLVYFYCIRKKNTEKKTERIVAVNRNSTVDTPSFQSIEKPSQSDIWDSITDIAKSINVYTYKQLQTATDDFNPSFWINGAVYRGVINGDLAAIKKKTGDISQEINLLNKINHFNLIRLSGVCFDEGRWYLVYEYAANGALSDWINSSKKEADKKLLNWKQRLQIALDVATGLNYLHSYTNPPYVHKDLTSHHVFLDNDMRAKIGNIGLARSVNEEGDFALTKHIVGTKGYMAPEYLENGLVTPKLDVYAFGVLLMEIITGREVSASSVPSFDAEENLANFMDPSLKGDYPADLASLIVKLIDSCLQKNPSDRPSTDEVVQALSTIMDTDTTLSMEHKISI